MASIDTDAAAQIEELRQLLREDRANMYFVVAMVLDSKYCLSCAMTFVADFLTPEEYAKTFQICKDCRCECIEGHQQMS